MTRPKVKIPRRTNAVMRKAKSVATWSVVAAIWLFFLAEVLSGVFAERVFFGDQFTGQWDWVSYRAAPGLFSFVLTSSLAGACFFGWVLLISIPKRG
jgi:hypothetical protein